MYLKLTFHGVSFYATLLEDKAPIFVRRAEKGMPVRGAPHLRQNMR